MTLIDEDLRGMLDILSVWSSTVGAFLAIDVRRHLPMESDSENSRSDVDHDDKQGKDSTEL